MTGIKYHFSTVIQPRDGQGQTNDDWYATVTNMVTGRRIVYISRWRWVLEWKTNPKRLIKAFERVEKREAKMQQKFQKYS